jgi:hypothetical protein
MKVFIIYKIYLAILFKLILFYFAVIWLSIGGVEICYVGGRVVKDELQNYRKVGIIKMFSLFYCNV